MRAQFAIGLQATAFFECNTIRDFYRFMLRIYPRQLQAHYAVPPRGAPSPPDGKSPSPPTDNCPALPAGPPAAAGDPIRTTLDRIWRRAEQELDAREPDTLGIAAAARPKLKPDLERLLIERQGYPAIEVCSAGTGHPLLLLGGLLNPEGIWHNQIRALSSYFRLLIFNKPGCGRSGVDIHRLSLASIVDDVRHVLDTLNLLAPLPILGFSFGGMVAQALAVRHPERVSALALINSAAWHRPRPDEVKILLDEVARCPEVAAINGDVNFALAATYREVTQAFDLRDSLSALTQPALVLSSDQDSYIPRERAEELARLLKQSRHVTLPDCGHFSLLTHADDVNSNLLAFFGAGHTQQAQLQASVA
jgi:pimeloyl-ACP methyl ester carboxylesterase